MPALTTASPVSIVVTCASRKTLPPHPSLRIRDLRGRMPQRVRGWLRRLGSSPAPRIPADQLYQGEHWQIARGLLETKTGRGGELWVLSAGYGLVRSQAPLASYSATFSKGHPDSVVPAATHSGLRESSSLWWQALADWPGPEPGMPRCLEALAQTHPEGALVIVASPTYLSACAADLRGALRSFPDPDRLLVISIGAAGDARIPHVLPVDARLQPKLGGTRGSLNVRIARWLLDRFSPDQLRFSRLRSVLAREMAMQPSIQPINRRPQSDEEIKVFIKTNANHDASASALLRAFRDQNMACEQGRFRRLYLEVKEGTHV